MLSIGHEARDEEQVVWQRVTLRATPPPLTPTSSSSPRSLRYGVLLRPDNHGEPCAEKKVQIVEAAHNVDRLVRVFRDVIRTCAIRGTRGSRNTVTVGENGRKAGDSSAGLR
jgi:hypothetical protein